MEGTPLSPLPTLTQSKKSNGTELNPQLHCVRLGTTAKQSTQSSGMLSLCFRLNKNYVEIMLSGLEPIVVVSKTPARSPADCVRVNKDYVEIMSSGLENM